MNRRGFTVLEVLVATMIMGIAVSGILSGMAAAARNAARLAQFDRATLLARQKMDELLVNQEIPRSAPTEGLWDPALSGTVRTGWRAVIEPMESAPGAGAGRWVVDRIQLEVWWMDGQTRRSFSLEGFRRGILRPGDVVHAP